MQGIFDAIMAGDWSLAFAIGVKGLEIVWLQVVAALQLYWLSFVGFFEDSWAGVVGGFKTLLASIGPSVVAMLDGLQRFIAAWATQIAQALGFEITFDGVDLLSDYNAEVQAGAQERRQQIADETRARLDANQKDRDSRMAAARYAVRAAQDDLTDLTGKAKRARDDMGKKAAKKTPIPRPDELGGGMLDVQPGGVLGTFSASVAGLLGRSSPDITDAAKKTAENTGEMKDLLEELLGKAGDGLVFE
jgi:hypothetical protein